MDALNQLENIETISITDRFSEWYYREGPISRDAKFAPFLDVSTAQTLGQLTMMLMAGLWQTRETRQPKTKPFVAEIFGDPNGQSNITGLPYDAMFWGARPLMKNDDSVFRGVFKGFEKLSINISLRRHFTGHGKHAKRFKFRARPQKVREEWSGIGKMIAGVENLLSLDLRFRDLHLEEGYFEALLGHQSWVNLTSLSLFNLHASAENLARVLEDQKNLKKLVLIRVAILGNLQTTGVVGPLAYPLDELPIWAALAGRVAAVLTLESVALFCLLEADEILFVSRWSCGRMPLCRFIDVEEAILSGRTNEWSAQEENQLRQDMITCNP